MRILKLKKAFNTIDITSTIKTEINQSTLIIV